MGRDSASRTSGIAACEAGLPVGRRTVSETEMSRATAPVRSSFARTIHTIGTAAATSRRDESLPLGRRAEIVTHQVLRTIPGLGLAGPRDQNRHRTASSARPTSPLGAKPLSSSSEGYIVSDNRGPIHKGPAILTSASILAMPTT